MNIREVPVYIEFPHDSHLDGWRTLPTDMDYWEQGWSSQHGTDDYSNIVARANLALHGGQPEY